MKNKKMIKEGKWEGGIKIVQKIYWVCCLSLTRNGHFE